MTFSEYLSRFPTEEAAIDYFINIRYGGVLTCPYCGLSNKVYRYRKRKKVCHCKNCNNSFSPFKGTIFEKSPTDLRKWFHAIRLLLKERKGISAHFLYKEIEVTYKTALRMLHQIREAMGNEDMSKTFSKLVEIDETYIGGKPRRGGHRHPRKRGRGAEKTAVVGLMERDSGRVYAQVMPPDEKGKKLTGPQLLAVIEKTCIEGTTVYSDDYKGYWILDRKGSKYPHKAVTHSTGLYFLPPDIHTNGIESFWAVLKRGYCGTYHSMSDKHLQRYLNEFCFRQNTRRQPSLEVFDLLLKRSILKPLKS